MTRNQLKAMSIEELQMKIQKMEVLSKTHPQRRSTGFMKTAQILSNELQRRWIKQYIGE